MPIYCGIDQALNRSGIAITDGSTILTTYFTTDPEACQYSRICEVRSLVKRMGQSTAIDTIAIEQAPSGGMGNGKAMAASIMITLNQLEFCLLDQFKQTGQVFKTLSAISNVKIGWPRTLGSPGTKDKMAEWLVNTGVALPRSISSDEIDAIGLCWASLVIDGIKTPTDIQNAKIVRVAPKTFRAAPESFANLLQSSGSLQEVCHAL